MNFLTESFDLPQNEQRKCLSWDMRIRTPWEEGPASESRSKRNGRASERPAGEVTGAQNRVKLTCANTNTRNHACEIFNERNFPSGLPATQSVASTLLTSAVTGRPTTRRPVPLIRRREPRPGQDLVSSTVSFA